MLGKLDALKTAHTGDYFNKDMFILKMMGIPLKGDGSWAYKIYSGFILSLSFAYPFIAINDLFKHEFSVVVLLVMCIVGIIVAVVINAVCYINREKLGKLLTKMQQDPLVTYAKCKNATEENLIINWILFKNRQRFALLITIGGGYICCIAPTVVSRIRSNDYRDWKFGFGPLTILNVTYSPNYEMCWMFQNVSILVNAVNVCIIIPLLAATLAFISVQFQILQNRLKQIGDNTYTKTLKDEIGQDRYLVNAPLIPRDYLNDSIKEVVVHHLSIIEIAKDLEEMFSYAILIMYLLVLGTLSFGVYILSLIRTSDHGLFTSIVMLVVATSSVPFIICYAGQQMTNEGLKVANAAYESNFVGTDLQFQKSLIMIIRRSQIPILLKAGKFVETSMITFAWILRTAYSVYMVLRHIRNEQ